MNASAATLPARCWCGRSQSLVRGCLFHAGDLEQRVGAVLRDVLVVDTETDEILAPDGAWLAFAVASAMWHLLPAAPSPYAGHQVAEWRRLGDLLVSFGNRALDARQRLTAEEVAAIHGEACKSEWPWGAS